MYVEFNESKRVSKQKTVFWWIAWAFVLGSILMTGLLIIEQSNQRLRLYESILELRTQQDEALTEMAKLQIELGSERAYERVVNVANSDLSMEFPVKIIPAEDSVTE